MVEDIKRQLIDNVMTSRSEALANSVRGLRINVFADFATRHAEATREGECTWCFARNERHRAMFVTRYQDEVSGDEWVHRLCWCCWFNAAFIRTPSDMPGRGDNIYGSSHISRVADCERRSFNRWARYAQLVNRWPRRWIEGYLAGTPSGIVVDQPNDDGGVPGL